MNATRSLPRVVIGVAGFLLLQACVSGKSLQDRHHLSRLVVPDKGSDLFFEASISPEYPERSAMAEAAREDWLRQWLKIRKLCINGFEIVERNALASGPDNPYDHDLRYRVRCIA